MNKADFIEKLSRELESTKIDAAKNLDAVLKCISDVMKEEDVLRFTGFGTFKAKQVDARETVTPKGDKVKVSARRQLRFSVGAELKAIANGEK